MRKIADDLDRIGNSSKQVYLQKAGDKLSDEKLQEMLDAETWLSADEAFEYGLYDVVQEANTMAASISDACMNRYKNVPKQLISQQQALFQRVIWQKDNKLPMNQRHMQLYPNHFRRNF
nr:ATP-dependent Clp protease proteolytic subunit [Paenibacillus larvae]